MVTLKNSYLGTMDRLVYTCGFLLTCAAIVRSDCPADFTLVRDTCYRLAGNNLNWADAQSACSDDDSEAALVSIQSRTKLTDVQSFIQKSHFVSSTLSMVKKGYWLDANDRLVEGMFAWHSVPGTAPVIGTDIDPDPRHLASVNSLWCSGRPQMNKTRNCLRLTGTCFEDEACETKLGVICETPPVIKNPVNMSEIIFNSPKYSVGYLF